MWQGLRRARSSMACVAAYEEHGRLRLLAHPLRFKPIEHTIGHAIYALVRSGAASGLLGAQKPSGHRRRSGS